MALLGIEYLTEDTRLGLWRIEDTEEEIIAADHRLVQLKDMVASYRAASRRKEVLAVYALLFAMTDEDALRIGHDELSRPVLDGAYISVSHTRGYAALIISTRKQVAVDIEYYSDRVAKIVPKFVRPDEQAAGIDEWLIHWSAKETIYKLFSVEKLDLFDIRLHPFAVSDQGELMVDDLKNRKCQKVYYRINENYVLTYAYI